MEINWIGFLAAGLGVLLSVSILLALIFQFRMHRVKPPPWPKGMEPPEGEFPPLGARMMGDENLRDVIYETNRIRMNERLIKSRLGIPWWTPLELTPRPGRLWLAATGLVFYFKHGDHFFSVPYADITGIDSFCGWYRGFSFKKTPALIVHYERVEDRFAVFQLGPGSTERFARLLTERVSRKKREDVHTERETTL